MEFESFDQALAVCMQAEDGSELQEAAMYYCLEHAPDDLKEKLKERFLASKKGHGQCGCGHSHPHSHG